LLNLIKKSNVLCGIALTPTTPISVLEYAIELCDFILLMLINPGYASDSDESQVIYAERKVSDCRIFLESHHRSIPIEIDGRISFHNISDLVTAGADIIVAGSSSMFHKGKTIQENYRLIEHAINVGLCNRLS
jgi:ribulose-phosphate 3-epimerase